jgi:heme A synthase
MQRGEHGFATGGHHLLYSADTKEDSLEPRMTNAALCTNGSLQPLSALGHVVACSMETPKEARKSKVRIWVYAIFICAFLCVWLSGMIAGLTAGACRNDRYEGEKKLQFCNISLSVAWLKPSSSDEEAALQRESKTTSLPPGK